MTVEETLARAYELLAAHGDAAVYAPTPEQQAEIDAQHERNRKEEEAQWLARVREAENAA